MERFSDIFRVKKPVIGMVHLRPLPGSPLYDPTTMNMKKIISTAIEEAKILEASGVDGVQVENMWDLPYLPERLITYDSVAALAVGVHEVSCHIGLPVGAECHMNGGNIAMACAVAGSGRWIRVFEWCNGFISQSGYIDAIGGEVSRLRDRLKADHIACLCDVNVKHGSHFIIHDRSVYQQAMDVEAQGGDAVIVTGFDTGTPPSAEHVRECKHAVGIPVLLGSGINMLNAYELLKEADGAIVGSWFKENGNWRGCVDAVRTKEFMEEVIRLRGDLV